MKRNNYLLATLLLSILTGLTACGDDNPVTGEPENPGEDTKTITVDATAYNQWVYINLTNGSSVTKEIDPIAGTYTGDLEPFVGTSQGVVEGLKLNVTRVSSDSVSIVLKDFAFGKYGMIGDITSGVKIEIDSIGNELGYVLAGSEVESSTGKYNVKATTTGQVIGKEIELSTTLKLGSMPMPIIAVYKGTIENGTVDETSFSWDIAIHRYDVKTNGGSGIETSATEIVQLTVIPTDGYVADEEIGTIMVDNTQMTSKKIGYATGYVNKSLSKWMNVDINNMPPTYTTSGKVYVMKTAAGKYAKIKFTDYTNDANVKGHITFDYVYPAQ